MKKLLAGAIALTISGSAMAAANSVGFAFGTNFFAPSAATLVPQNGQNFTIGWALDNDVSLGVYTEQSNVGTGLAAGNTTLTVNAIQVSKGVMKNVTVGLNLGSSTAAATAGIITIGSNPLADIFGTVNILSGSGDKVSGSLQATVSARFTRNAGAVNNLNGTNVGLAVGITF